MPEEIGENSSKMRDPATPFLERLRILCGYVENGTDTVVKYFQDSAPFHPEESWIVIIGSETAGRDRRYYASSLEIAFEAAFQDPKNDPFR